jgi:hypothetical protein
MKVCWISAGVSSFIAGWLVKDSIDKWIYIDVEDQHPDSLRFIHDCEKAVGKIEILKSEQYKNVEDVCRQCGIINTIHGAACTGMLKKAVRKKWENEQYQKRISDLCYVWGMDANERRRAESIIKNFPEFTHEFPLIERNLSKQDCHAILERLGIKRPIMYDLGYNNNNCIGCVKGGKGYWNKIRIDFPAVFEARARLEREIGGTCINGIFLDELPQDAGRMSDEIMEDCSIMCYLAMADKEDNK